MLYVEFQFPISYENFKDITFLFTFTRPIGYKMLEYINQKYESKAITLPHHIDKGVRDIVYNTPSLLGISLHLTVV